MYDILGKCMIFLVQELYYLAFPPSVYEDSLFPTSLPTFVVGVVFDDSYSNRHEVES
jgi:hypothetical protein